MQSGASRVPASASPFTSFWMGGFEGADHVNPDGIALDMAHASGHVDQIEEDHRRAAEIGIRTVRESIGWRLAEPAAGCFDLARTLRIAASARSHGIQIIWTLMHYGTPTDVSFYDDALCERFVRFASAVARALRPVSVEPPVYNLINEIGFLSWAVCETNLMHPYRGDPAERGATSAVSGYDVKRRLVRATLAAIAAIREIDPRARFLHIEPLVHVVAPAGRPELGPLAERVASHQWQAWDLLCGRAEPELGGDARALDLIGVNYYAAGQWEATTEERLDWHTRDPRRRPLRALLASAWERYRRPLIVAETSHYGEGRAAWLHETAAEVLRARDDGVPVDGICLYPLVDRPDWNRPSHWHRSGLWDVDLSAADAAREPLRRVLCRPYAAALQRWQDHLPVAPNPGRPMPCLIVFSHLRWGFVYQRPQHLMSRLSEHYRVLFVEEPLHTDGQPRLDCIAHGPQLDVLVPHTPIAADGFHDDQLPLLQAMLADHLAERGIDDRIGWLYTPMALPLLASLAPRAIVYDCMDELSGFLNAPRQLRQRETALFKAADLVFTGGPALYEAKRHQHARVHCLPSSVDAAHFAPANLDPGSTHAVEAAALQSHLPRPRLGFFGVIDERFDIGLLTTLADSHPHWQLMLAGPVVKIDPALLPSRPNIHWLGMQPYDRLPYLVAGWDVCLMPFALNEATRYISPTKTLEYMAAQKPIVSTPVTDVVAMYGETVRIAAAGPDFVAACERALAETPCGREQRIGDMLATVDSGSWDRTARTVHLLLEAELAKTSSPAVQAAVEAA